MEFVQEGKAKILVPEIPKTVSSDMPVFYNPKMRVNRDLAVLGLEYLCKKLERPLKIADPLSASGIRAIRFLLETSCVEKAFANDISSKAVQLMEENFRLNDIPKERYEIHRMEANFFLRKEWGFGFDYVDLDPFGTPVPFIESVALSMKRGGILSLTATDTAPLSGTYPKTCMRRYMARPIRNEFKHEVGIRILIKKVIELAAQYDIAMIPIFAYSHLHYFKLFFVKERGVERVDKLIEQFGYIQYCFNCMNRETVKDLYQLREKCPYCGSKYHIGGPLWIGKLWDEEFTNFLYEEASKREEISKETKRILKLIREESQLQTVGFYVLSKLAEKVKLPTQPPIRIAVKFFNGARTHFVGDGFRTNLSFEEVMNKMEELKVKQIEFLKRKQQKSAEQEGEENKTEDL